MPVKTEPKERPITRMLPLPTTERRKFTRNIVDRISI
jgi:hypothetical protein